MNLKLTLVANFLVILASIQVMAQEMPDNIRQTIEKHAVGDWIDTESIDGTDSIVLSRRFWTEDRNVLRIEAVGAQYQYHEMGYWDGKAFVFHGLSTDGGTWHITYDQTDGKTWKGHGIGTYQGKTWDEDVSLTWNDEGFEYKTQADGKPFLLIGRRQYAKSCSEAFKAFAEFMVGGVWTTTNGDGESIQHAYSWIYDKQFLSMVAVADPEPSMSFQGVDPTTGFFKLWVFGVNGCIQGTGMQSAENEWLYVARVPTKNGVLIGTWTLIATDENTLTIKISATLNGEKQDLPDGRFHRVER